MRDDALVEADSGDALEVARAVVDADLHAHRSAADRVERRVESRARREREAIEILRVGQAGITGLEPEIAAQSGQRRTDRDGASGTKVVERGDGSGGREAQAVIAGGEELAAG